MNHGIAFQQMLQAELLKSSTTTIFNELKLLVPSPNSNPKSWKDDWLSSMQRAVNEKVEEVKNFMMQANQDASLNDAIGILVVIDLGTRNEKIVSEVAKLTTFSFDGDDIPVMTIGCPPCMNTSKQTTLELHPKLNTQAPFVSG